MSDGELEQLKVKLAAALVVAETQAEELAELRSVVKQTTDGGATLSWMAIRDDLKRKLAAQAEELERLRHSLDSARRAASANYVRAAKAEAKLTKQAAVIEAARAFAGQPGIRLPDRIETPWLALRDALDALTTTDTGGQEP